MTTEFEVWSSRRKICEAVGCSMGEGGELTRAVLEDLAADGLLPHPLESYSSKAVPYG